MDLGFYWPSLAVFWSNIIEKLGREGLRQGSWMTVMGIKRFKTQHWLVLLVEKKHVKRTLQANACSRYGIGKYEQMSSSVDVKFASIIMRHPMRSP